MMKNLKFFALASVALFAACSNEENPVLDQNESKLALRLETPVLSRAIETPIGTDDAAVTVDLKDVTLYFWTDEAGTTAASPATMQLSTAQIAAAKTTEGTMIRMPKNAVSVSMTGNNSISTSHVANYQGKNVLTEIPVTAPAKKAEDHTTIANAKQVNLKPSLDMARLEVLGKVKPKENPNAPEGKRQAYKSLTLDTVFVNNYKETQTATTLKKFVKSDWASFRAEMFNAISTTDDASLEKKEKAAAFQIFPTSYVANEDKMTHIVLKMSYVYNEYVNTDSAKRKGSGYLTIKNFKNGDNYTSFVGGTIYKMDLAWLSDQGKFGTDDSGNPVNPLDPDPEMEKTDLYLQIEAVKWTHKSITPDI